VAFSDLINAVDNTCISVFGDGLTLSFYPQSGGGPISVPALTIDPRLLEDYVPGSSQGVNRLPVFVRFVNISPLPQKGDIFVANGINYDLPEAAVDREGGAVLKLKKSSNQTPP
jgi:hypothetical protein